MQELLDIIYLPSQQIYKFVFISIIFSLTMFVVAAIKICKKINYKQNVSIILLMLINMFAMFGILFGMNYLINKITNYVELNENMNQCIYTNLLKFPFV
jgi:hypothetical protein